MLDTSTNQNEVNTLKEQILPLIDDLRYPSESDEAVEYFEMEYTTAESISVQEFKLFNGIEPDKEVEAITLEDFFEPLTRVEDWFGEEEKKYVENALKLQALLTEKLTDIQVLKIGAVEIDVFLFGIYEENKWIGVKTILIET
ncbi:nuclease A inhibitor family protein [Arcicella sp. DC2W]|uniref:Nuclease A inhibitor family protein n=1 Tax=Arcicella gelida TaxID=2984195 RepID=A0ABU5RYU6_9BACT|nr:nuclease A inhibitor family protein [Arcicella sp. DC2W]MEA5401398.1 nuclease A inhibitor family protein [Arcicella sp. DC2W]